MCGWVRGSEGARRSPLGRPPRGECAWGLGQRAVWGQQVGRGVWASSSAGPPTTQDPAGGLDTSGNTDGAGRCFWGPDVGTVPAARERGLGGREGRGGEAFAGSRRRPDPLQRWLLASRKIYLERHARFSFLYKTE